MTCCVSAIEWASSTNHSLNPRIYKTTSSLETEPWINFQTNKFHCKARSAIMANWKGGQHQSRAKILCNSCKLIWRTIYTKSVKTRIRGPMPNVMAALPIIDGVLCESSVIPFLSLHHATKFGWRPLLEYRAVTLSIYENARLGLKVNMAPGKILSGGKSPRKCIYFVAAHSLIGNRTWAFDWYQNRWPWMTLNGVMALFCVISTNSGSFRAHCVKVHVRYFVSWSSSCKHSLTNKYRKLVNVIVSCFQVYGRASRGL